ncbi:MAG: phosphatase PAP2 family protein [Treponema sp.]|nr:phosphatase PAP2 family protein [Treponema sp.]
MLDIQYLLFLQNLRELTGGIFNEIFNGFSKVGIEVVTLLPIVIYWSVDKEWGKKFIATLHGAEFLNGIVKLSVCAYRPWIRSDLIQPAGDSKLAATGYSFPSGHTTRASAVLGCTFLWQYKKQKWIAVLSAIGIFLVAFSRNFLGVHTPQDVICGFLLSMLVILIVEKITKIADGKEKLADKLTILGIIMIAATLIYIKLKPYPMDYIDGKLLVDPNKMMNDSFKGCGSLLALFIGLYLDRNFLHYEIPVGHKNLPLLTAVGLGIHFSWTSYFINPTIVALLGSHWGNFIAYFITTFFIIVLYPMVIKKFTKSEE